MPQSAQAAAFFRGNMTEILYKSQKVIVVYKSPGVPSQSDASGECDAMSAASHALAELGEDSSLWLVHRLDRVVGGILAFARSKDAAARLSELVGGSGMEKEYYAVVSGDAEGGRLIDYLYKDARQGKAFVVNEGKKGAKRAELEYTKIASTLTEKGVYTLVRIRLYTGRFHQIRAQFSSRGMSIVGDGKYGSHDNKPKMPALFAYRLSFKLGKENINVKKLPDINIYPWSLFDWSNLE